MNSRRVANLYIFRHGQTEWNRLKIFQGSHDIPLNETGRDQAKQLRKKLDKLDIEVVLTSDLSRAHETAQIAFAHRGIPFQSFSELREANLGVVEGMPRRDFLKKYGDEMWKAWISQEDKYLDFKFPEGETKRETRARAVECINQYIEDNNKTHIAVSTHGGVVSRVVHYCKEAPKDPVPIPNGCLYKIVWEDGVWTFRGEL